MNHSYQWHNWACTTVESGKSEENENVSPLVDVYQLRAIYHDAVHFNVVNKNSLLIFCRIGIEDQSLKLLTVRYDLLAIRVFDHPFDTAFVHPAAPFLMYDLIVIPIALLTLHLLDCLLDYISEVPLLLEPERHNLPYVLQEKYLDRLCGRHTQQHVVEVVESVSVLSLRDKRSVENGDIGVDELENEHFENVGFLKGVEELVIFEVNIVCGRI